MNRSKNEENKIKWKIERCRRIISSEIGIEFSENPEKVVAVCNAGLSTGLALESLLEEVKKITPSDEEEEIRVNEVAMLPGKSYCFMSFLSVIDAERVLNALNAVSKLGQNGSVLYLSYSKSLPSFPNPWTTGLPPGLILLEDIVDEYEEIGLKILLNSVPEELLKHRKVTHYGYEFIYKDGRNNVDPDSPLSTKIPEELRHIFHKIQQRCPELEFSYPDQMTVNRYEPGQGIPPHTDTPSAFEDPIFSLSLGSAIVMDFRKGDLHSCIRLPGGSMLIMSGESRYEWTHGIAARHTDVIPYSTGLTVQPRGLRISCTFRKIITNPVKPLMAAALDAAKLEEENVHKVYNEIAEHFSETRHSPWPKIENFLHAFPPASIILDIGCGNGKYLGLNRSIFAIGCDRSDALLNVCQSRDFNVFQCDCLQVPFKDECVDGAISIAVIHHLATDLRRLKAIKEMARVLVRGGQGLIYVWAKNQAADNRQSSYLRQNKQNRKQEVVSDCVIVTQEINGGVKLPVHTNRTQFQAQDILVPWKLKEKEKCAKEFLRYYHVFEEGELEKLVERVSSLKVVESYYDQGNWCVIFEKVQ